MRLARKYGGYYIFHHLRKSCNQLSGVSCKKCKKCDSEFIKNSIRQSKGEYYKIITHTMCKSCKVTKSESETGAFAFMASFWPPVKSNQKKYLIHKSTKQTQSNKGFGEIKVMQWRSVYPVGWSFIFTIYKKKEKKIRSYNEGVGQLVFYTTNMSVWRKPENVGIWRISEGHKHKNTRERRGSIR